MGGEFAIKPKSGIVRSLFPYPVQGEIMKTARIKAKVGSDIDSWCGKCKRILAHTVEAMVGDKPARVNCNTCKSQHSYKPHPLDRSSQRARKRDGSDGQTIQRSRRPILPRTSMNRVTSWKHPTFGRGITTAVKDGTKIEVLFESGSKTLIHGRRPSLEQSFGY